MRLTIKQLNTRIITIQNRIKKVKNVFPDMVSIEMDLLKDGALLEIADGTLIIDDEKYNKNRKAILNKWL